MEIDEKTAKEREMYETSEQWNGFGLCEKCRRRNYCNKDCTARKKRMQADMMAFAYKKLFEKMSKGSGM